MHSNYYESKFIEKYSDVFEFIQMYLNLFKYDARTPARCIQMHWNVLQFIHFLYLISNVLRSMSIMWNILIQMYSDVLILFKYDYMHALLPARCTHSCQINSYMQTCIMHSNVLNFIWMNVLEISWKRVEPKHYVQHFAIW